MEGCCKDGKMEECCAKDGMGDKEAGKVCGSMPHGKFCNVIASVVVGLGVAAIVLSWLKVGDGTFMGMDSDHLLWNGMALLLISKVCKGCGHKRC